VDELSPGGVRLTPTITVPDCCEQAGAWWGGVSGKVCTHTKVHEAGAHNASEIGVAPASHTEEPKQDVGHVIGASEGGGGGGGGQRGTHAMGGGRRGGRWVWGRLDTNVKPKKKFLECQRGHEVCACSHHPCVECDVPEAMTGCVFCKATVAARVTAHLCCRVGTRRAVCHARKEAQKSQSVRGRTLHTHRLKHATHTRTTVPMPMRACWCVRCCAVCCGAILPAVARCRRMRCRVECLRFASLISWRELCAMCADRAREGKVEVVSPIQQIPSLLCFVCTAMRWKRVLPKPKNGV